MWPGPTYTHFSLNTNEKTDSLHDNKNIAVFIMSAHTTSISKA